MSQTSYLKPGATIGVLGGGQLGKMLVMEAKRFGYRTIVLDTMDDAPACQIADDKIIAAFDDVDAALALAKRCDVVTYEFENINVDLVRAIEAQYDIHPGARALAMTQHRGDEKTFLRQSNIPVAEFKLVNDDSALQDAISSIGFPAVLKTCRFGYDGKGQQFINDVAEAKRAFKALGESGELIYEQCIDLAIEVSVIVTRGQDKQCVTYPVAENIHKDSILDMTIVPARLSKELANQAIDLAKTIAEALDVVGTFAVEMFIDKGGQLLVNEIAPRPHNSGHFSIDACFSSQFENQLRAICGLPLGNSNLIKPAVMVNLLGELDGGELVGVDDLLEHPQLVFHWYGKSEARVKRKMGHFTVLADTIDEAISIAKDQRQKLSWLPGSS